MKSFSWPSLFRRGHVTAILAVIILAGLLHITWLRWGDLIIDLGREMYVPARLASGAVLYRDVFYLYGPFSPYFNALLFKLFGIHILVLVAGGVGVTALTAFFIYKITRMFLDVLQATLAAAIFLVVLVFGYYVPVGNYNFILPYSYPATHGILLSLAGLYFLFRSLEAAAWRFRFAAGACLFLTLLTRAEMGGMLALAMTAVLGFNRMSGDRRPVFRPVLVFPVLLAAMVYALFFVVAGSRIINSNLGDLFRSNTQASPFAALLAGVDAPGRNTFQMLQSLSCYAGLSLWFALGGYLAGRAAAVAGVLRRRLLYALLVLIFAGAAAVFLRTVFHFTEQYRCVPFIYLLAALWGASGLRSPERRAEGLKLLGLSLFAFLLSLRILLNAHPWHYGFYILVPGLVVYHVFLFRVLPQMVRHKQAAAALYAGLTLVLVIFAADHFRFSQAMYAQRTFRVPSERGEIAARPGAQADGVASLVDFFRRKTSPGTTLAVFPEGVMINFLAARETPLYYYSFLPQDMVRESVEDVMVADMAAKKPDYVVILQRSVLEYGSRGFGVDYAHKLLAHIQQYYEPAAQYGPLPFTAETFSAVILKRRL